MVNKPCPEALQPVARTVTRSLQHTDSIEEPLLSSVISRPGGIDRHKNSASDYDIRIRRSCTAIAYELLPAIFLISLCYLVVHATLASVPPAVQPFLLSIMSTLKVGRFVVLAEGFRRYLNDGYLLKNTTVSRQQGYLSYNYHFSSVKFLDIREVRVDQSLIGRLLNYGDIKIGTASTTDFEVILEAVGHPTEVADWIQLRKTELLGRSKAMWLESLSE